MGDMSVVHLALGICVGVSLSAACGFRIFVPLLVSSIGVHFFGIQVNESLQWVGTWTALIVLSTATICEMFSYYIPWVDNALDMINTPLALVAGTILVSGMLPELSPCAKWCTAGILGGSAAGATKITSSVLRGVSSTTTGGLGNGVVSTLENLFSTVLSVLAFVIPIITFAVVVILLVALFLLARKFLAYARQLRVRRAGSGSLSNRVSGV